MQSMLIEYLDASDTLDTYQYPTFDIGTRIQIT